MFKDINTWSKNAAALAVDALIDASLISCDSVGKATEIIAEEIGVRLQIGDHPLPNILHSWDLEVTELSPGHYSVVASNASGLKATREGTNVELLSIQVVADAYELQIQANET